MSYQVTYSHYLRQYLVINLTTGLPQSSWDNRLDAGLVCVKLNAVVKAANARKVA